MWGVGGGTKVSRPEKWRIGKRGRRRTTLKVPTRPKKVGMWIDLGRAAMVVFLRVMV